MNYKFLLLSLFSLTSIYSLAQGTGNDTPCGASVLNFPAQSCGATSTLTVGSIGNATATTTPPAVTGCPTNGSHEDRWFRFTAPNTSYQPSIRLVMDWSGCSGFLCGTDGGYALYSGATCNSLTLIDCDAAGGSVFGGGSLDFTYYNLTPGATYWARVWEQDDQGGQVAITAHYAVPNDFCGAALPLQGLGNNCDATATNEPNSWAPQNFNSSACPTWGSMENAVWYTFAVTAQTPQPITIAINNIACAGGNNALQMGIWSNTGTCNLANETYYTCNVVTAGNTNLGPVTLPVGNYYLFVDGDAGANCTWAFSSPQLLVNLTNDGPKCANQLVNLTASINQGTAPYTYRFSGPSITGVVNNGTNPVYTVNPPVIAGTYTVQITDSGSPAQTVTTTTVVSVLPSPTAPVITPATPVICPGGNVALNAGGGYATYNWGSGNTNQTLIATAAGSYTVTVANSVGGCTTTSSVTVAAGTAPTVGITPTTGIVCGATPLTLTATGGGTYSWSGGQNTTAAANNVTTAGTYTCTVTNAQGCTGSSTVTITGGVAPTISNVTATCNLAATNFVVVATLNGTTPFTVSGVNGTYNNITSVWTSDPIPNSTPLPVITVRNSCDSVGLTYSNPCGTTQVCVDPGCFGASLITNGNFEAGNTGFTSGFTPDNCANLSTLCGGGLCEYRYAVYNSSTACVPTWNPNVNDHTFGTPATGKFLMANYPAGTVGNSTIWCQNVNVSTNTNYCFGGYFLNLLPLNSAFSDPQFGFTINGVNLGNTVTAPNDEAWHFNGMQFNSGASTTMTLCIDSRNNGQLGNDIAIDDVSLRPITNGTPPSALNDAGVLCPNNATVVVAVLGNDVANSGTLNTSTLSIISAPPFSKGFISAVSQATGEIEFTADPTFTSGSTQFQYQICNTGGCCSNATVTIAHGAAPTVSIAPSPAAICVGNTATMTATSAGSTFAWSGGTTPNNIATVSVSPTATTTYTVFTTGANGCTATATQVITVNPLPATPTITGANTVCGNTISLTASAATAYAWSAANGGVISSATNGQAIQTATAGTYTVTITNAQSCTATASKIVTLGTATPPTITSQVQCATNSVLLNAGSGYTAYLWDGTTATQTLNVTTSGTHTVQITGTGGCTATASINVTVPTALMAMATPTPVACFGNSTGVINASGMGGTPPYQFSIDNTAFVITPMFNNLAAGSHTVIVRDANMCTASTLVSITQPAQPLSVSVQSQTAIPCNAGAVGSATVAGAGGTTAYSYSIDGLAFQTNATFTNLAAGSHIVTVKDNNLCTAAVTVTIANTTATVTPTATVTQNVNCNGTVLGAALASATGGTSPYTYSVDGGAFTSNNVFTGLTASTHTLAVRDANGCQGSATFTVTQAISTLSVSISSQTNVVGCNSANTGSVTLSTTGGTAPLTFSIDGLAGQASSTFNNLSAGGHITVVSDANGCTAQQPVTITQSGSAIAATAIQTNATCNSLGSVTVSATGGITPYTYSYDGSAFQTNPLFANAQPGGHTITVRDNAGCIGSLLVNILSNPVTLTVSASPSPVQCSVLGSVVVNGSNGSPIYNYSVDGGAFQNGNTFSNLLAGAHTVRVLDANGCTVSSNFTISTAPNNLNLNTTSTTAVTCFGLNTGSFSVSATGGTAPYLYSNGGGFQTNTTFNNQSAGAYIVTVRDNNGCTASQNVSVTQPTGSVQVDFTSLQNVTCFSGTNGSITLTSTGGTPPFLYQFGNNPQFTSTSVYNNLAAGAYAVTVRDNSGCQDFIILNVAQPSPVEGNIAGLTAASCYAGNNGAITVLATGGTPAYTYYLDGAAIGQTSPTFTGVTTGNHTIRIVDNNNCQATQPFAIAQPSPVSSVVTAQRDATCYGGADGSITVTGTGGTAPYTYNGSNNNVFTNLAAGNFTVTVTDANGCSRTQLTAIAQPSLITPLAISSNALCNGSPTGSLSVNATGGTPPYQFSNGGVFQSTGIFSNQTAGNYNVTVRDMHGCTASATASVAQPASAVSGTIVTTTAITCKGNNNGSVTFSGSGGSPTYTYSIGGSYFNGGTFNNLAAGTYTATIRDNNGCQVSLPFIINEPSTALTLTPSNITNVLCNGTATGGFTVTGAGGTSPYEYSFGTNPFAAPSNFNNLAAGSYQVTVRDLKGCTSNVLVNLLQATPIDAQLTNPANSTCNGLLGSVVVVASGGTGTLSYILDNNAATAQPNGNFSGLTPGNHSITVRDLAGCSKNVNFTITQPAALSINTISQQNITCLGTNNGAITVLGNGGTPNYTYQLDNGTPQAGNTFLGITQGIHTIRMTDAAACTTTLTFNITQPLTGLAATFATPIAVRCNGGADGKIALNATGGSSPYLYSNNGSAFQPNNGFENLHAGTYTVTVRDAGGCTFSVTTVVNEPAPLEQGSVVTTAAKCFGATNGQFTISAIGGIFGYSYSVQGNTFTTNNTFTGLAAGTYRVIIKDANLCTSLAIVNIAEPSALTTSLGAVTNIGCPGTLGSIAANATGGTSPYQYSIDGGTNYQNLNKFTNLSAGTYTLTIRDANGCTNALNAAITAANQLVVNAYADKPEVCSNECVNLIASGNNGTGNYSYNWTNIGNGAAQRACPSVTTTYQCVITDASGCTNQTSVTINVNAAPSPTIQGSQAICEGNSTTLTALGGAFTSYQWSNGIANSSSITTTNAGIYEVMVTDAKGCKGSSSVAVAVRSLPDANAGIDINIYPKEPFQLAASGAGANGTYLWTAGNNLSSTTVSNPTGSLLTDSRSYTVIVTDQFGCSASDVMTVNVENQLNCLRTDEGITPNGDGINETWIIECLQYFPDNQVEIFNRWGQLIFTEKNYRNLYDGTLGSENALPDGTYYYIVKVFNVNSPKTVYKGTLTILR